MNEERELSEEEKLIAEERELKVLNEIGFDVKTRLFGKEKIWKVKKIPLAVMFRQSHLFFKLKTYQDQLQNEDVTAMLNAQFNSVVDNAKLCAEIIAVTILGSRWKIKLFKRLLTEHLYENIDSKDLMEFTQNVLSMNDYQSFMTSTTLLSAVRVTSPMKVEKTV